MRGGRIRSDSLWPLWELLLPARSRCLHQTKPHGASQDLRGSRLHLGHSHKELPGPTGVLDALHHHLGVQHPADEAGVLGSLHPQLGYRGTEQQA